VAPSASSSSVPSGRLTFIGCGGYLRTTAVREAGSARTRHA
jgi:hypothetical protein